MKAAGGANIESKDPRLLAATIASPVRFRCSREHTLTLPAEAVPVFHSKAYSSRPSA
jgi:hypothetical protein